jgi:peroxiredoxin
LSDIRVGDLAPDFELEDQNGKKVRLSQYRGKKNVLLAFFPFAFSPVCTNELGELKEKEDVILKLDTQVLASSVKFPILGDFGKQVVPLYGALYEDKGFAKRTIFIVDKKGKVAYRREYEPGTQPDINDALDLLKRLK